MPPLAPCPPTFELEQFLLGRLEEEDSQSLESHLTSCMECQQQLTTLAADDEFVQALRTGSSRAAAGEPTPLLADAPEELVKLLVPHFKQIATALEDTAVFASGQATAETSTLHGGPALPWKPASENAEQEYLGRYEIRGVLGSGGMGTVLDAYDPLLKRSVAIKVIQSKLLTDPGMAGRLVREAQAAAAVEHDHIVAVYAVEMHGDAPCIIMPLLRGMTLKQRLEDAPGPLPFAEIVRIGREAASGLAAAHVCGLIHCDIKPGNLWLEAPRGRVKVLDFGLAIVRGDNDSDAAGISGTPGYLAPEQARGLPLDQRTDVFSLGCVLYRMATGVAPFTGQRHMQTLWTVLSESPTPVRQLNPQMPPELSDLISRMLAREPSQRPACATVVVEALDALERRLVDLQSRVVRRRWLAALFVVALLSGTGVGLWAVVTAPPAELPVKMTFVGDEPAIAVVLRHEGQEQALTLGREKTLDLLPGDYVVRAANAQSGRVLVPDHFTVVDGKPQTLRIALVGEVARHATHSQPVTAVAVTRDSNPPAVFSVGLDRALVAWDTAATTPPRFVDLPHAARCLAISPNGDDVATAGGNKQPPAELAIRMWETRQLIPHSEPLTGHTRMITALAYSPDGKQLASAGADDVLLWNLSTGEPQALAQTEPEAIFALAFSADGQQLLTGSDEGQVVLWDTGSRAPLKSYNAGPSAVRAVAFLSERLVAAGDDGVIRVWKDAALEHEWLGHGKAVLALAVSPDARQLLTGDAEGTIRVWSVSSGQTTHILRGHTRAVNSVAFTSNGRQAVSGGADGVVRLWQLPFGD